MVDDLSKKTNHDKVVIALSTLGMGAAVLSAILNNQIAMNYIGLRFSAIDPATRKDAESMILSNLGYINGGLLFFPSLSNLIGGIKDYIADKKTLQCFKDKLLEIKNKKDGIVK